MPAYRYVLRDLLTDDEIAQLPLSGVSFERRISRTGSLSATLDAPDARSIALGKLLRDNTGRSALWVYRDAEVWWAGIPWTVTAKQGRRGPVSLDIQAATFDSYAMHRELLDDLDFIDVDAGIVIPSLWRTIQADFRGHIGVQAVDQPTGSLVDQSYYAGDKAKVGQLIQDIGDTQDGPEHTIDAFDEGGIRTKWLRVASRIGSPNPKTVFQGSRTGGGNVLEWSETSDATKGGTTFQTRGDADGGQEPALSQHLYADGLLAQGWPLLDVTEDRSGLDDDAQLDAFNAGLRDRQTGAVRTSAFTVQVGQTGWSPNRLGDAVRIKQSDPWHGEVDMTVRPVGVRVTPPTRDSSESVELMFGDD